MSDEEKKLDLEAWDAQSPPPDFAERVLARIREEEKATPSVAPKPAPRPRRWGVAGGAVAAIALAAALLLKVNAPASHGEAIAKERTEVAIGSRALAVLEPGAQVSWDGDDVQQPRGDVFYRVEKGARFRVHTPAGDVEVKGTCFMVKVSDMQKRDVKSGAVGAALTALAFVAVYEGKVAVSHAGERVDLAAGETAQAGASGVTKSGAIGEGQKKFDDKVAELDPTALANENLVSQVAEYKKRLEAIAHQKADLESQLKKSEEKLAAAQNDGAAPRARAEFDLTADDWKELAKDGTMKMAIPCNRKDGWKPSSEQLDKLGLSPQDGPTLTGVYKRSNDRLWQVVRPLCKDVMGSQEAADKLGAGTCFHVVLDLNRERDREGTNEAMREVAEVRAGLRPMPGPNEPMAQHPIFKMFMALTGEMKQFETDLAQSLGPDEAHRVAYHEDMCMGHSTWGGPGPREPKK